MSGEEFFGRGGNILGNTVQLRHRVITGQVDGIEETKRCAAHEETLPVHDEVVAQGVDFIAQFHPPAHKLRPSMASDGGPVLS